MRHITVGCSDARMRNTNRSTCHGECKVLSARRSPCSQDRRCRCRTPATSGLYRSRRGRAGSRRSSRAQTPGTHSNCGSGCRGGYSCRIACRFALAKGESRDRSVCRSRSLEPDRWRGKRKGRIPVCHPPSARPFRVATVWVVERLRHPVAQRSQSKLLCRKRMQRTDVFFVLASQALFGKSLVCQARFLVDRRRDEDPTYIESK